MGYPRLAQLVSTVLRLTVEMLQVSAPERKSRIESAAFHQREPGREGGPDLSIAVSFLMMILRIAKEQREIFRVGRLRNTENHVDSERPVDQGTGPGAPHD